MDKKLLDALNNLSFALDEIAIAINSQNESSSATSKAISGGDFIKEIKEINIGVKQLQKDTKQILSNQQTIMKMAKSTSSKDSKTDAVEGLGKNKESQKNLKDGLGVIMLIAVAVLALGIAFNIIGKVNFVSVIALSIALPLLAIGFAKVHKTLKEVGFDAKKDSMNFLLATTVMSLSIVVSSWILSMIKPIGFSQLITAVLIGGMFVVLSYSINKLLKAFQGVSMKDVYKSLIFLPLILPAISLSIALSSWILALVKPIGFGQAITAILIAAVFTVISFGIRKLISAFKGMNPVDILLASIFLPRLLPAISAAITASSWILSLVKPIGFGQAITVILIAGVFTIIAFGLNKLIGAFKGLEPAQAIEAAVMLPVLLVAISYAIAWSSHAFSLIKPITFMQFLTAVGISLIFIVLSIAVKIIVNAIKGVSWQDVLEVPAMMLLISTSVAVASYILKQTADFTSKELINIVLFSLSLAATTIAMGIAIKVLSMLKVGIKDALVGSLLVVIISVAIMVSSHILSLGKYENYPDWKWALGVGLSLIAFTPAILLLGIIAMSGVGALAILAGAGMILVVAGTIVATSYILSLGKYGNYPPLEWSSSVALSMAAFTVGMVLLGGMIVASFGLGAVALAAGSEAVLMVAQTIVDTSFILQKGKYTGGPTKDWSEGISLALGAFSPVYSMLMNNGIMKIFGGGVGPDEFAAAIRTVSGGIVDAANYFAVAKVSFSGGPKKEWAEGVGMAIAAFAPVYSVLAESSGWLSSGPSVDDMKNAILTIADGIVTAAGFFANNKASFNEGNYPSKNWGEGVGAALAAFAPVFTALSKDTGWFTSGDDVVNNMKNAILTISASLVGAAWMFSKVKPNMWNSYPPTSWGKGVGAGVESFLGLFQRMAKYGISPNALVNLSKTLQNTLTSMSASAKVLWLNQKYFKSNIDPNFVKKMSRNIIDYVALIKLLDSGDSGVAEFLGIKKQDPIENIASGMVKIAKAYDVLAKAVDKFSGALNSLDGEKVSMFRSLTGNLALLSAMDSKMFSNMLSVLESRGGVFAKLLQTEAKFAGIGKQEKAGVGGDKSAAVSSKKTTSKDPELQRLDAIISLLTEIKVSVSPLDDYLSRVNPNGDVKTAEG